jgi:hypothetical protein
LNQLVTNDHSIVAVDRQREGITFGEISIPPAVEAEPDKRDEVEAEFLQWREAEMVRRWQQKKERLSESRN